MPYEIYDLSNPTNTKTVQPINYTGFGNAMAFDVGYQTVYNGNPLQRMARIESLIVADTSDFQTLKQLWDTAINTLDVQVVSDLIVNHLGNWNNYARLNGMPFTFNVNDATMILS